MIALRGVAAVRAAEEEAFRSVPEGTLMQRAAHALAITCARVLVDTVGGVVGARVVLLVGSGNNGGDALWAGARLAARGARVDGIQVADRVHAEGAAAFARANGRMHQWSDDGRARHLIEDADLVIDGILGIGGRGALGGPAALAVGAITDAVVVAVDVPSGVDADTGEVAGVAVVADVTVTFGAAKPGLVVAPGCLHSGDVQLIDIGLAFADDGDAVVLDPTDVAAWVSEPVGDVYKYSRGVVGVAAGSRPYPGAALLVTGAARHANVGMVRYLDRSDGNGGMVLDHFPDVIVDGAPPADQGRVTAWACGSGFPGDHLDEVTVAAVLDAPVPVVLDAGALSVVAESASVRATIARRRAAGLVTVLTPHDGEFGRISPGLLAEGVGRMAAARAAADALAAVIVLKGPGTIIAAPGGDVVVDTEGSADLGVAGSGDALTGLVAGLVAGAWAEGDRDESSLVEAIAAGVWLHGRAGRIAAQSGSVTATDVVAAVRTAIATVRAEADA